MLRIWKYIGLNGACKTNSPAKNKQTLEEHKKKNTRNVNIIAYTQIDHFSKKNNKTI